MTDHLAAVMAAELALPVDPRVTGMAEALAGKYPDAARGVLFYGSCLRESQLDGLMLDFYLIVSSYEAAYGKSWMARANRLIPPNVFPFTHQDQYGELVAKYAVLDEADFARLCSMQASDVSVWARFAQPTRLVWVADEAARARIVDAVTHAPLTLATVTRPMMAEGEGDDPLALWRRGFDLTYSAELRAERKGRSASIVDFDPAYYRRLSAALTADGSTLSALSRTDAEARWASFRRRGKWLTLARLAKATGTYAGGIDYLAWKINRHAGTEIAIKPWQRKWPIMGALTMLPKLFRSGAIK
ncbi:hypothetical protein DMP17_12050 [Pseudonocardia sp. TMWB2A]|uniref:hypothetical protein n=1 Tax=Pseudonocardia sp. TMWB2A TaxID=687430 RepID=UPI00307DA455